MQLITYLLQQLKDIVQRYNSGEIDKEQTSIKLELMKQYLNSLEINYTGSPLKVLQHRDHHRLVDQLFFQIKYKAIEAIKALQICLWMVGNCLTRKLES